MSLSHHDITVAGQIAIASSIIFTSASSTALLHFITLPYVTSITKLPDGRFETTKLNLIGNHKISHFSVSDVQKVESVAYPFANFRALNDYYYVNEHSLDDIDLKDAITKVKSND